MEQFRIYMTFQNLKDHHVSFLLTVFVAAKLSRPGSVTFIFILLQQHPYFFVNIFGNIGSIVNGLVLIKVFLLCTAEQLFSQIVNYCIRRVV